MSRKLREAPLTDTSSPLRALFGSKRRTRRVWFGAALGALLAALFTAGACASQRASTEPCQAWTGTCKLRNVGKLAEYSSPVPFVIYEALYEPVGAPASVQDARVRFEGRAIYEGAIREHIASHPEVACQQTLDAECFPGATTASAPAFTPPAEPAVAEATGCKALEDQGVNADPTLNQKGAESLPEQIDFEVNSTQILPESQAALEGAAARLMADPSLVCVAIVSQSAPGEAAGLAEQRTWAIRRLLVERGVPGERLQTYALQPAFSGPAAEPMAGMPVERKVRFKVLLKK